MRFALRCETDVLWYDQQKGETALRRRTSGKFFNDRTSPPEFNYDTYNNLLKSIHCSAMKRFLQLSFINPSSILLRACTDLLFIWLPNSVVFREAFNNYERTTSHDFASVVYSATSASQGAVVSPSLHVLVGSFNGRRAQPGTGFAGVIADRTVDQHTTSRLQLRAIMFS